MKRILSIVSLAIAILAGCTKDDLIVPYRPDQPADTTKPSGDTTKPSGDTTKPPTDTPAPYGEVEAPYIVVSLLDYSGSIFKMEKYRVDGSFRAKLLDDYFSGNHFIDNPDFSAKGDKLCYAEGDGIYVLDLITGAKREVLSNVGAIESTEMSPDGNRIAYLNWNGDFTLDLNIIPGPEMKPIKLTNYENSLSSAGVPSFSPDGNRIAFPEYPNIMVMDWNGNNRILVHRVESQDEWTNYPIFNKDGTKLIYFMESDFWETVIVTADIRESVGNNMRIISELSAFSISDPHYPVISEDGSYLYFAGNCKGYTNLYKVPLDGSGAPVRVAFNIRTSGEFGVAGLDYVEK